MRFLFLLLVNNGKYKIENILFCTPQYFLGDIVSG